MVLANPVRCPYRLVQNGIATIASEIVFEFATKSTEKASVIWGAIFDLEELKLLEGDYKRRLNEFSSQFPYFVRKNNLKDLRKEFDWIHKL